MIIVCQPLRELRLSKGLNICRTGARNRDVNSSFSLGVSVILAVVLDLIREAMVMVVKGVALVILKVLKSSRNIRCREGRAFSS